MSASIEPKLYCPVCETEVYLTYEKIEPCVLILITIFTVGIGLVVYYLMRKPTRCVKCGTYCRYNTPDSLTTQKSGEIVGTKAIFCDFCGTELNRENQEFCPNCGAKA